MKPHQELLKGWRGLSIINRSEDIATVAVLTTYLEAYIDPKAYERASKAYRQSLGRPPGMAFNPNHIANPPDSDMP